MRILVTNDDSVSAEQLLPLIRWCRKMGDVMAVVPEFEQSGKSHGIQLLAPFRAAKRQIAPDVTVWTVDSTPADCVRFAVLGLKEKFDLVISGINRGFNMGLDVMYSGTVAGIFEAAALGIPAVAFSTSPSGYAEAPGHLDRVWAYFEKRKLLEKHSLYNVNIPASPGDIHITRQGGAYYSDRFEPQENDLYRPMGHCVHQNGGDLTLDTDCVVSGHISITPMTINRTDMDIYNCLRL